jgi:nucleoside-diphosphate-sugar epimerase
LSNDLQWDICVAAPVVPDVDAVVHCAALVGDWGPEREYRRVNVQGTEAVLDAFKSARRFIYVSSASVYSTQQADSHLSESAPVGEGLLTAYAKTKLAAEQCVLASKHNTIILRPHIVYGPGDTTLMPRVIAARRLGCLAVPGDGQNRLSVTHVWNFAHAVERALATPEANGVFNICDRDSVSVDKLLRTLLQKHGFTTRLLYIPRKAAWAAAIVAETVFRAMKSQRAPTLTRYLVRQIAAAHTLDISKSVNVLGYDPGYDYRSEFEVGLKL